MENADAKARAAIAMLREGIGNLDFRRVAKASSELVRVNVLDSTHGIELSKTVGFLRHVFHHLEEWERGHRLD
jgi:vacuolar-type H+-ATPase subunit B/Vma2